MKSKILLIVGVLIVVAAVTLGGGLTAAYAGFSPYTNHREAAGAPDVVVTRFYEAYLAEIAQSETGRTPLVARGYRTSPYLHPDFVARVDVLLDSFDDDSRGGGFDPFLLAQDIPADVQVVSTTLNRDSATVIVDLTWGGNPEPTKRAVTLIFDEGRWQINGVSAE